MKGGGECKQKGSGKWRQYSFNKPIPIFPQKKSSLFFEIQIRLKITVPFFFAKSRILIEQEM